MLYRSADRRREAEAAARTAARNATLANAFPDWEKHILPNWRVVFHDDPQGRYLRKLWWNGTMPVRWRGRLWSMSIGNGLALAKTAFARATERVRIQRQDGRLAEVEQVAKEDAERTLPALKLFQEGRVMHDDLMELLLAWSVYEKRTPRYVSSTCSLRSAGALADTLSLARRLKDSPSRPRCSCSTCRSPRRSLRSSI